MPQTRNVTLNYDAGNFGPSPRQVPVAPGDTIVFQIGAQTRTKHPGCKLRITLHKGEHFSQEVLQHTVEQTGAEGLTVLVVPGPAAALAAAAALTNNIITGYRCELLAADLLPIPGFVSDGTDGGEIVPDTGA